MMGLYGVRLCCLLHSLGAARTKRFLSPLFLVAMYPDGFDWGDWPEGGLGMKGVYLHREI